MVAAHRAGLDKCVTSGKSGHRQIVKAIIAKPGTVYEQMYGAVEKAPSISQRVLCQYVQKPASRQCSERGQPDQPPCVRD